MFPTLLIRFVAIVVICGFFAACSKNRPEYCSSLDTIASDLKAQKELIRWVDGHLDEVLLLDEFLYGGGVVPGEYRIPDKGIDWEVIGMDVGIAQIRIITKAALEKEPILSVSFSELSRQSILVKLPDSDSFGIKNIDALKIINNRIAVYCNIQ